MGQTEPPPLAMAHDQQHERSAWCPGRQTPLSGAGALRGPAPAQRAPAAAGLPWAESVERRSSCMMS